MDEVLIVGSGAAGVGAALGLTRGGVRPRILDVGFQPDPPVDHAGGLYATRRRRDVADLLLGPGLEGLLEVLGPEGEGRIAKLDAPGAAFVTRRAGELGPLRTEGFQAIQSFAAGGLASAWGAGLYRYTARDLEGTPLTTRDLDPWFDALTEEAGVSGAADDLEEAFGPCHGLAPPLRLSANAGAMFEGYRRRRAAFHRAGVLMGRPRLAVREAPEAYQNLEFWVPDLPHVYTPRRSLKRLIEAGQVRYTPGVLVEAFEDGPEGVTVHARELESGARVRFQGRRVVLAAGPVNSARLVLASRRDHETRLAILDNPAVMVPLFLPARLGAGLEQEAFGLTQLNVVHDCPDVGRTQGSLLEVTSPARRAFFPSFPLAARSSLRLVRELLPSMLVLQLFHPAPRSQAGWLQLEEDGTLVVHAAAAPPPVDPLRRVLAALRSAGAYGHPRLARPVPPGHAVHYAGPLPLCLEDGSEYSTTRDGRLRGTRGVFVADGSVFPSLPAKNSSFAVMAWAMRLGATLAETRGPAP